MNTTKAGTVHGVLAGRYVKRETTLYHWLAEGETVSPCGKELEVSLADHYATPEGQAPTCPRCAKARG